MNGDVLPSPSEPLRNHEHDKNMRALRGCSCNVWAWG
jgi:hypothetical protein